MRTFCGGRSRSCDRETCYCDALYLDCQRMEHDSDNCIEAFIVFPKELDIKHAIHMGSLPG